jgi:6-phosphogluconolactonase
MQTTKIAKRASVLALGMAAVLLGCSSSGVRVPQTPKFLIATDGATAGANVNVFPINATTGVLGAAVAGSPFDMGLTIGMTIVVHPNGHFVYIADGNDGSIHALNVNETTGIPAQIAAAVVNESGSFYEPRFAGDSPTQVLAVTPKGHFLYSANNDATVGAYKINANGSLTHIADLNLGAGACDSGAITANDSFVWVTDTCSDVGPWYVRTMKIGADGSLTNVSAATLLGVDTYLWSISVDPTAGFLYVGDEGGGAQVYSFSINAAGSLTQLGPQIVENSSSDCRVISFSPDGKFFYTTDDIAGTAVHAFSVNSTTGAITELAASPYTPGGAGQVIVDLTGHFVYLADPEGTGEVLGFTRDQTTGALTPIGPTTTANGSALGVNIIR